MTKYFELISDLPMSIEFFVYMGMAFTGLIIAYMVLWIHTHKNPAKIEECPEWADPEKWAEVLAFDQELKKRKWWEY